MPMKPSPNKGKRRPISRAEFIGVKMANLLYSLKSNDQLSLALRAECAKLQDQWDSVCAIRLNNPITLAELEKQFKDGTMK